MENQKLQHNLKYLEIVDAVKVLADDDFALRADTPCGTVSAVRRDCAYKIQQYAAGKHGEVRTTSRDAGFTWKKQHGEGIGLKKGMVMLLVFVLSLTAQIAQGAYVDVVDGLSPVGYWRLGESSGTTATDRSGNGINGTYNGTTLAVAGALGGDSDTAVDFDGSDDDMITMSSNLLRLTGDMSVSLWVNIDLFPSGSSTDPLFTIDASAQGSGMARMTELAIDQNGDLRYTHEYGSGGSGSNQHVFSSADLADDTWYNIALTRDSTAMEVTVYIDGSVLDTYSYSDAPEGYGNGTLYLGKYGTDLYDGSIDEIAVFDYELTGTNVSDIYNAAQVPEPATIALLGLGSLVSIRRRRR